MPIHQIQGKYDYLIQQTLTSTIINSIQFIVLLVVDEIIPNKL